MPPSLKILPTPTNTAAPSSQPVKLKKIIFPVTLTANQPLPQLFLINSNVFAPQKKFPEPVAAVPEPKKIDLPPPPTIKPEPEDDIFENLTDLGQSSLTDNDINIHTPLPEFSESVKHHLSESDVTPVWGTFISECAKHYFSLFPNIQNSSEYQAIGRKMYAYYPSIAYDGKEPWSFFCKCLSQKIRHIKWKIKQKSMGMKTTRRKPSIFKIQSIRKKVDHRYTPSKLYKALLKELSIGWSKGTISDCRVVEIIRRTSKGRRTWLEAYQKRKIHVLITEFPCFLQSKYLMEDFLFTINQDDVALLLKRFDSLFTAVGKIMKPSRESKTFSDQIAILKYMEEEISFDTGSSRRNSLPKSIICHHVNIPEAERASFLETTEDSLPFLHVFSDGEKIEKMCVAGDKTIIEANTTDFFIGLMTLLAVYYVCGLEYPKHISQILALFQIYILGDSYDGPKSAKLKSFMKILSNHFDVGSHAS